MLIVENSKKYPHLKVIFYFTTIPAFVGSLIVISIFFQGIIRDGNYNLFFIIKLIIFGIFSGGVMGFLIYGIPAFVLALIYAWLHLEKKPQSYIFCALWGILGVRVYEITAIQLWYLLGSGIGSSSSELYPAFFSSVWVVLISAFSSALAAYLVLPKAESFSKRKSQNCDASDSKFHDDVLQFSASNLPEKQYFL